MQRRSLVLIATSLASFTATLDNTVVAVALRDIQSDLGAGVSGLQGVVTAYTVALAALLLTGGTLADVAGRRRVFVVGLAVFAAGSLGCALSGSITALVSWRVLQGAGAALVIPAGLAVLAGAYPEPAARARAVGIWAATGAAALLAGPVVGGLLVQAQGWPAIFFVNLPLCLGCGAVVLMSPAGQPPEAGRRLDVPGQVLAAIGLAGLTYGVVLAGRDGIGPAVLLALVAGGLALVGFTLVERRSADPLLPPGLITSRDVLGTGAAAFAASLAVFVLLVFLSLFLQLVQGRAALPTAVRLLPLTVGLVLVAPLAVRLRPAAAIVAGLMVSAVGMFVLGVALSPTYGGVGLGLLLGWIVIGLGLTGAPVVVASLAAVSRTREGLAAATVSAAREVGGLVAVGGLGALVVSRLAADLASRLVALGIPRGKAADLVQAVLRGEPPLQVARRAGPAVGLDTLFKLQSLAASSYVTSTRLALTGAAVVLLIAAVVAGLTLGARTSRVGLMGGGPASGPGPGPEVDV